MIDNQEWKLKEAIKILANDALFLADAGEISANDIGMFMETIKLIANKLPDVKAPLDKGEADNIYYLGGKRIKAECEIRDLKKHMRRHN